MQTDILHVRIITRKDIIFEGDATSVSSSNISGKFDILNEHAKFITLIENQPIIIRVVNKNPVTFTFPIAIIYSNNNKVNIYTYTQAQNS